MVRKKKKKVISKKSKAKKRITKRRVPAKRVKKSPRIKKPSRIKKKPVVKKPAEKGRVIGVVTHYFPKVRAAVVKLKAPLAIGDVVKIKGHTTDFTQNVSSMQIDRVPINLAKKGQEIGLLVDSRARGNDIVYKV
jgi:hypothetical protein